MVRFRVTSIRMTAAMTVGLLWVMLSCQTRNEIPIADLPDGNLPMDTTGDSSVDGTDSWETDPGLAPDIGLGPEIAMDCAGCGDGGDIFEQMRCAVDLCDVELVLANEVTSPMVFSDCALSDTYRVLSRFGDLSNDLAPKSGSSYVLMGTGNMYNMFYSDWCSPDGLVPNSDTDPEREPWIPALDPWDFRSGAALPIFDMVQWTLTLQAPEEAQAFSLKYVFFSAEYDEWISSDFNDKFYILLNAPITTGGRERVINFTECREPSRYFDFSGEGCDTRSGTCCYIAINSALSDCCWYPRNSPWALDPSLPPCSGIVPTRRTNISGTGFECASSAHTDGPGKGSSTGWLMTAWPISPGETFSLTFHIHDTNDGRFDSAVLLDSFRFHRSIEEGGGTVPID